MQMQNAAPIAKSIYFVTVHLNAKIHEQAHGFTDMVHRYAYAATPMEAECTAEAWLKSQGCDVRCASAGDLRFTNQDVDAYTFPHQIINIPQAMLDVCYDRRGYPPSWRDRARSVKVSSLQ